MNTMIEFPGQISFTTMSILEGEIERTSLPDWRKDELIDSLVWTYEDEVDYYWEIIRANRVYDGLGDIDAVYSFRLNDPKQ